MSNSTKNNDAVLLVYSGGLDTSVCIPLMREEYGYKKVITVTVDVGQERSDISQAAEKAAILKTEHYTVDAKEEFVEKYCWPSVKANGDYQGYPMSTSIARPLIAAKAAEMAKDPVCGMSIDPNTAAATREHDGADFYFCSTGCADKFDADPHRYGHPHDH